MIKNQWIFFGSNDHGVIINNIFIHNFCNQDQLKFSQNQQTIKALTILSCRVLQHFFSQVQGLNLTTHKKSGEILINRQKAPNNKTKVQKMGAFHNVIIMAILALYLLGRICDDINWYQWDGISTDGFQAIALGSLTASAIFIAILRLKEEGGWKVIFLQSQLKFIIPWALVITLAILVFQIFGCHSELPEDASFVDMDYNGCILYSTVLMLTNLNYSLMCNTHGDLPILVVFLICLFAEIIYSGTLLITFIKDLRDEPKDYSILFVSIQIACGVLVMDLLFRCAYEEKEKELRHKELEQMVLEHHEKFNAQINPPNTNNRLQHQEVEVPQPKIAQNHTDPPKNPTSNENS